MQVFKTRTCVWTCDVWPNRFASPLAISVKSHKFQAYTVDWQSTCVNFVGWPNGEKLASTYYINLNLTKVNATPHKSMQVGGQTKRKSNASRKLVSTCKSLWAGLNTQYCTVFITCYHSMVGLLACVVDVFFTAHFDQLKMHGYTRGCTIYGEDYTHCG